MNESPNKRAIMVGLFVSVGLAIFIAGVMMVGNLHDTFKSKVEIVSLFEDVSGLQTGNNIWFSGVKVGTVSCLNFFGKSQVAVCLNVEIKALQYIRKDAKVKISSDGLIGNKILVIYGGTESSKQVQEGDTLEVEKTFSSEDMINMLQKNNQNILSITTDLKNISKNLANGEGSMGKLLNDNAVYDNINAATASLKNTSLKANLLVNSLASFSSGLHKKGTLVNELVTDTLVFNSVKASALHLQETANTARLLVSNLKQASTNPNTPLGVLVYDETTGTHLKETIKNLELSSQKLDENLEAMQHNFLLRGFFKKKAKAAAKIANPEK
jgi:phospholipid/cholesterol/gamma-HCH transport system substrate-binding protein